MDLAAKLVLLADSALNGGKPRETLARVRDEVVRELGGIATSVVAGTTPPVAIEAACGLVAIAAPDDGGVLPLDKLVRDVEHADRGDTRESIDRAKPVVIGLEGWSYAGDLRLELWEGSGRGFVSDALRHTVDVVLGGTEGAFELELLGIEHDDSPTIAWLEELARRVSGEGPVRPVTQRLDRLLADGRWGRNVTTITRTVARTRRKLRANERSIRAARRSLGVPHGPEEYSIDPIYEVIPEEQRAELVDQLVAINEAVSEGWEARLEREGPFAAVAPKGAAAMRRMDELSADLLRSFRSLWGLEILVDALPKLASRGALA